MVTKSSEMNFPLVPRFESSLRDELKRNLQVQFNELQAYLGNNLLPPPAVIEFFSQIPQNISTTYNVYYEGHDHMGYQNEGVMRNGAQTMLGNDFLPSSSSNQLLSIIQKIQLLEIYRQCRRFDRGAQNGDYQHQFGNLEAQPSPSLYVNPALLRELERIYQQNQRSRSFSSAPVPHNPLANMNVLNDDCQQRGHSTHWRGGIMNTGTQPSFDPNLHQKLVELEKFYQQKRLAPESLAWSPDNMPTYHNFFNEAPPSLDSIFSPDSSVSSADLTLRLGDYQQQGVNNTAAQPPSAVHSGTENSSGCRSEAQPSDSLFYLGCKQHHPWPDKLFEQNKRIRSEALDPHPNNQNSRNEDYQQQGVTNTAAQPRSGDNLMHSVDSFSDIQQAISEADSYLVTEEFAPHFK